MSVETMFISISLLVAVAVALSLPFLTRGPMMSTQAEYERQRDALLVYYHQVTATLRDLQEDWETGRLSQADYDNDRARWMQRGAQILYALEELDRIHPALAAPAEKPPTT